MSILYFINSLHKFVHAPGRSNVRTFHVPKVKILFRSLGRIRDIRIPRLCCRWGFVTVVVFYGEGVGLTRNRLEGCSLQRSGTLSILFWVDPIAFIGPQTFHKAVVCESQFLCLLRRWNVATCSLPPSEPLIFFLWIVLSFGARHLLSPLTTSR